MPEPGVKRRVAVVSACMRADGLPDFALTEVEVSQEEYDNGAHYALADASLTQRGYEEPFVHFAGSEMPPFLLPAVLDHVGLGAPDAPILLTR